MEQSFENIEDVIARYLAGDAAPDEAAMLSDWRNADTANEALFAAYEKIYAAGAGQTPRIPVNTDAAWNKLQKRLTEKQARVIPFYRHPSFLRAAAALFLVVGLAVVFKVVFAESTQSIKYQAANTQVEQKLPDGSKVFMNRNSEISYEAVKGQRRVKLKGEAFFEVVHNEAEPFVVAVGDVLVKDIGTAFNVKTLSGDTAVEVVVESGEVQFYTEQAQGLKLVKGERAIYNKNTGVFVRTETSMNLNVNAYRTKQFNFNNSTLGDALVKINEVYGSNIVLQNQQLAQCRLTVQFDNESLELMVSVIAETLDLDVEIKGDQYILKGEACKE